MSKTKMIWCVAVMMSVAMACDDKKSTTPVAPAKPVADSTVSQAQEPVDDKGAAKQVEPLKVLDAQAAKQAVEAWAKSQNEGSFEAYSQMYAARFTGVKRVGAKRFQYDRKGWLEDRSRMFKKKVEVTLDDIEVVPGTSSVIVRATQTWASGSYKDTGPKQLVLVPEGKDGALKITREEMLSSQVVGQDAKPEDLGVGAIGFSMSGKRDDLLVWSMPAQRDWYDEHDVKSIVRAESAVAPALMSKLPNDVQKLKGQKLNVFGDDGKACEMVIKGFSIVGEVVPHFGQVQYWNGDPAMSDDGVRKSDEEVGRGIMGLADGGGLYVAANVEPTGNACKGWTWGSVKADVKASAFTALKGKDASKEPLKFFRSLPGYVQIQKGYKESTGSKTDWSSQNDGPSVHTATIDGRTFVFVQATVGHGCGDFLGEFWALFEQGSDFVLLSDGKSPGVPIELHSLTDLNADGTFEFVGPKVLVQAAGPVWRVTQQRDVPFLDCPC